MSGSTPAAANAPADADARPWLESYPPDVPAEIDTGRVGTLIDLFRENVSRYANQPALESFGKQLTYVELSEAANAVASWLQERGHDKGDRIAIMLPNVLAYPAILFGALIAGCTVVNINPLYTAREVCHQVNDAGACVLFVGENFGHTVEEAGSRLKLDEIIVVTPGDLMGLKGAVVNLVSRRVKKGVPPFHLTKAATFRSVLAVGRKSPPKPVAVAPDDMAFLQYTGGTTGSAKGAVLLHRNVAANVAQIEVWMGPFVKTEAQHGNRRQRGRLRGRVAWIRGAGAMTPTPFWLMRCGRRSGVPAPACGSGPGRRRPSQSPDAPLCASAARPRSRA